MASPGARFALMIVGLTCAACGGGGKGSGGGGSSGQTGAGGVDATGVAGGTGMAGTTGVGSGGPGGTPATAGASGTGGAGGDAGAAGAAGVAGAAGASETDGGAAAPAGTAIDGDVSKAQYVAVDGTYVYWSVDGGQKLQRRPKDGSGTTEVFFSSSRLVVQITTDATTVYWTEAFGGGSTTDGAIRSCPQAGCPTTPPTLVSNQQDPTGLAVDDTYVYWCTTGTRACRRAQKADGFGGNAIYVPPSNVVLDYASPNEIAVDTTTAFFAADGLAVANTHLGTVASCPLAGCANGTTPTTIGANNRASGLALDATHVFWVGGGVSAEAGLAWQADKDGSHQVMLGPGGWDIVTDGNNVYWSSADTIYKCAVGGCVAPTALASAPGIARGMAIDATHVYWAEYGGGYPTPVPGSIRRIEK